MWWQLPIYQMYTYINYGKFTNAPRVFMCNCKLLIYFCIQYKICDLQKYYLLLHIENLQLRLYTNAYMDFVSRLKRYIECKNLQNSQVADMAGIPRPTLSQLLTGRNKKVSNELIEKLHNTFPTLNVLWLLFGDGPMEVGGNIAFSEPQNEEESDLFSSQIPDNNATYDAIQSAQVITAETDQKNETRHLTSIQLGDGSNLLPERRVQSIMVFYSDNSFEVFEPARKSVND